MTADKTLIELLDIDVEKTKALDAKITALIREHVEPGHNSVAALLVVAARVAAHNNMPFVLAVSVLEWLYTDNARRKGVSVVEIVTGSEVEITKVSGEDKKPMH